MRKSGYDPEGNVISDGDDLAVAKSARHCPTVGRLFVVQDRTLFRAWQLDWPLLPLAIRLSRRPSRVSSTSEITAIAADYAPGRRIWRASDPASDLSRLPFAREAQRDQPSLLVSGLPFAPKVAVSGARE
jgi:hypothetical protein